MGNEVEEIKVKTPIGVGTVVGTAPDGWLVKMCKRDNTPEDWEKITEGEFIFKLFPVAEVEVIDGHAIEV